MGTKIVNLPPVVTVQGSDVLPMSQSNGVTRTTYKMSVDQLKNYVGSSSSPVSGITSIGFQSHDNSISFVNNPLTQNGSVDFSVNSLSANKILWSAGKVPLSSLEDGGAMNGQVLTYNQTISSWEPATGAGNTDISGMVIFDTPGLHSFTVPSGVTKISIEMVGGGGGGGGVAAGLGINGPGGGGGGAYVAYSINVTPDKVYTNSVMVGSGGYAGTALANTDGGDGGDSYCNISDSVTPILVTAGGGKAGKAGNNVVGGGATGGFGGNGGSSSSSVNNDTSQGFNGIGSGIGGSGGNGSGGAAGNGTGSGGAYGGGGGSGGFGYGANGTGGGGGCGNGKGGNGSGGSPVGGNGGGGFGIGGNGGNQGSSGTGFGAGGGGLGVGKNGVVVIRWGSSNFGDNSDFTGSNQSLTTNGYQKLPGGLIMQWGIVSTSGTSSVTFPISFINSCFGVNATVQHLLPDVSYDGISCSSISKTGFTIKVGQNIGSGDVFWTALGN